MTTQSTAQPLIPGMRWMLYAAGILVFISGIQLFVLSDFTDQFFAWTIKPSLTAAFLGAAYWSSCVMEIAAARQSRWVDARVSVPAVFIFTGLTLVVTLLHIDRFHFNRPELLAQAAAWAWLLVYALVPIALAVLLVVQLRAPGSEPPRQHSLPSGVAIPLALQALPMMVIGLMLLITPTVLIPHWPWALTALTARAIGAWSLALGLALAHSLWENDWARVRVATLSYTMFGVLELIALLRYTGDVDWNKPQSLVYVLFMLSMIIVGFYSWQRSRSIAS